MIKKRPIIFSDFDGTFTVKDIGYSLFRHFSQDRNLPAVADWKAGRISSRQCLQAEVSLLTALPAEVYEYIEQFRLRDGAVDFYRKIQWQKIPFYIVSDGLDLYIDYVLRKYNLAEIEYMSNRLRYECGQWRLSFPFENDTCSRCGSCKGSRIREKTGYEKESWNVIFIGDGLSDICALPESNLIFARGDLLQYCRENGQTAIEYNSFFDILEDLKRRGVFTD